MAFALFFCKLSSRFETIDRKAPLRLAGIREQMDSVRTGHGDTSGSGKPTSVLGWPKETDKT